MGFTEVAQQCAQEILALAHKVTAQLATAGGTSQDTQALTTQWENDQVPLIDAACHWLVDTARNLDQTGGTAAEASDADHQDLKAEHA